LKAFSLLSIVKKVLLFLSFFFSLSFLSSAKSTIIHEFIKEDGSVKLLKAILKEKKSQINEQNDRGETALLLAVHKNIGYVKTLILHGADPNIPSNSGYVPLTRAIEEGQFQIAEYIIKSGKADLNLLSSRSYTFMHDVAAFIDGKTYIPSNQKTVKLAKTLYDKGLSLDAKDETGRTPLHIAVEFNNFLLAKFFIENNADINATDHLGRNSLHLVEVPKLARLLLNTGKANINAKTKKLQTPLHTAVFNHDLEIVKLYVEAGVDVFAKDIKGETALDYTSSKEYSVRVKSKMVQFLKKEMKKQNNSTFVSCKDIFTK